MNTDDEDQYLHQQGYPYMITALGAQVRKDRICGRTTVLPVLRQRTYTVQRHRPLHVASTSPQRREVKVLKVDSAGNFTHRHECFLGTSMKCWHTITGSTTYEWKAPVGSNLVGRLSSLVVVSETTYLYGPIA